MKRLIFLAVSLLVAALLSFSFVAVAQEPAATPSPAGTTKKEPAAPIPTKPDSPYRRIRVLKGGNLAFIAERCGWRQTDWRSLVEVNPELPKAEKVGEMWRVMIQTGQILNLPIGWEYGTLDPEYLEPYPPATEESPGEEEAGKADQKKTPAVVPYSDAGGRSLWAMPSWLVGLLLILAVVLLILWWGGVLRHLSVIVLSRWRNPARYPAVVIGGLSEDPRTALGQVEAAYSGLTAQARCAECGYFEKTDDSAPDWVLAKMATGDRTERRVYVRPGQRIFRLMIGGTVIWYSLMECGNALRITPPRGWRFVVGAAVDIPRTVTGAGVGATTGAATGTGTGAGTGAASAGTGVGIGTGAGTDTGTKPEPQAADAGTKEESAAKEEPPTTEEAPIAEAEETAKQTLTSNEVEVTIGDLLIKVATGNGHIPATKIRTGDGVEVTLQQP